jgi:hypothetical protein
MMASTHMCLVRGSIAYRSANKKHGDNAAFNKVLK